MHHFVADAPWDAAAMLRVARDWVLTSMVRHGPVAAWIVDDTAFPKKGAHSVGGVRQYCGVLGKQDNCRVAVSVSVGNDAVSLPVCWRGGSRWSTGSLPRSVYSLATSDG
jgi:SRSO17 transposase